jgi:phosphate/sulfate permease
MFEAFRQAFIHLPLQQAIFFFLALLVAFGFEFINGFHDTANAVTTVIYTRTLRPTSSVLYSGVCNFLGVMIGGSAIAFSIVSLLPVDVLVESRPSAALAMVMSLLIAGAMWNLGTWYLGLPVSSSHTLIGAILGVGIANSLLTDRNLTGVNWLQAEEVGLALLLSPLLGFLAAGLLLLLMRRVFRDPRLYVPPVEGDKPPFWVRATLICTCGAVSFAHGSNDGQKGMGLILLVLIGFMPAHYALDPRSPEKALEVREAVMRIESYLQDHDLVTAAQASPYLERIKQDLDGFDSFAQVPLDTRWKIRQAIFELRRRLQSKAISADAQAELKPSLEVLSGAIEYIPTWVVMGVALALGIGTTIGYKRIVITVAEKIGKTHLTYAQGAAAEVVAALTILIADFAHLPVSTTHVLSSGVAGTMWANGSGVQASTLRRIALAWILTMPMSLVLAAVIYWVARWFIDRAG